MKYKLFGTALVLLVIVILYALSNSNPPVEMEGQGVEQSGQ